MSSFFSLRALALGLGVSVASVSGATAVEHYGALKVVGTQIQGQNNQPAVLRGMSLYWSLSAWGNSTQFWNAGVVNWLAEDWHANVVRAAMAVENGGYLTQPEQQKQYVNTIVQAAVAKGIYVIIDWHDHNATNHESQAIAFFQEMARKYGHLPNVIYEIFNEPERQSWADVKSYSTRVIDAIRAIDPDNLILVGSPQWDQAVRDAANSPITGRQNIAYTMHFYAGTHGDWLRGESDYALTKIPLFISEWGTSSADGNGGPFTASSDTWLSWADQRKLSWCNWSVHNLSESSAALKGSASPTGGWNPSSDLSLSGQYVRGKMRAGNPAANAYTGSTSSSSSVPVSSSSVLSSSSVVSSSSVISSSSIVSSSSSVVVSSSSTPTGSCITFTNGTGNFDKNCYNTGLANMQAGTCYTMNPDRKPSPQWINSNANETWWWVPTACGNGSISSSSTMVSSSSVAPSSSSVIPSSSSAILSSSSIAPSSSSSSPSSSSVEVAGCANPILYNGGSISVGPTGVCLEINASAYKHGVMASVRNNGTAYTQVSWWGGLDQNVTACKQDSKALNGNGAQVNNFVVGKNASGKAYLQLQSTNTNTYSVIVDVQNWQNGSGCSESAPPLARRVSPLLVQNAPAFFGLDGSKLSAQPTRGVYYERTADGSVFRRVQLK